MRPVVSRLAVLILALGAMCAQAQILSARHTATVTLSDADTLVDARRQAQLQIQHAAAAQAGTFVEARAELRQDDLREAVTEVIAAVVEISDVEETVGTANGRPTLTMTATTRVDKASVERRMDALRQDDALRRQMLQLVRENAALEQELLNARRLADDAPDAEYELAKARVAQSRLDQGRDRIRGLAVSLAPAIAEAQNTQLVVNRTFARAEADIEEGYFAPMLRQPIQAHLENVRRSVDGQSWIGDVVVRLGFDPSTTPICRWMDCKLPQYGGPTFDLRIADRFGAQELSDAEVLAYWSHLASLMSRDKVVLHVQIGPHSAGVPLHLPDRPSNQQIRDARFQRSHQPSIDDRLLALRDSPKPRQSCGYAAASAPTPMKIAGMQLSPSTAAGIRQRYADSALSACRLRAREASERWDREYPVTIARVTAPQTYRTSFAIPAEQGSAPPTLVAQVVRLPHNCTVDEHPACNEATHARYRLPPIPGESSQRAFAVLGAPSPAQH